MYLVYLLVTPQPSKLLHLTLGLSSCYFEILF